MLRLVKPGPRDEVVVEVENTFRKGAEPTTLSVVAHPSGRPPRLFGPVRELEDDDLVRRQREHLRRVRRNVAKARRVGRDRCAHDQCPTCVGTFVTVEGDVCPNHSMLHCGCRRHGTWV